MNHVFIYKPACLFLPTQAIGGLCNTVPFTPNVSFWCNPRNPRDGARGMWNGSGGLRYNASVFSGAVAGQGRWTNLSRGVAHVWHDGGHWVLPPDLAPVLGL